jgi:hypothetical protein
MTDERVEVCATCWNLLIELWRACTKGDMKKVASCLKKLKAHHNLSEVEIHND